MIHALSQIPTRVLEISEVERFNDMLIKALTILNGVGFRAQLPGASSDERAFAQRTAPVITACVNEANKLMAHLGGIVGFIAKVPLARTGMAPIVVSELNLAGISLIVECAIQIQEQMERARLADVGIGFGVPLFLTILGFAL